jgi:hypothetical protein
MGNRKQMALLGLLGQSAIGIGLWAGMQSPDSRLRSKGYPDLGGDFTLTSDQGPVSLADLRGKVVPIYFGFTSCPDVCITSLSAIGAGLQQLSEAEQGAGAADLHHDRPRAGHPGRRRASTPATSTPTSSGSADRRTRSRGSPRRIS